MKVKFCFSILAVVLLFTLFQNFNYPEKCLPLGEGDHLVGLDSCGKLYYSKYSNKDETNKVNTIPDFSFAGFKGGGVAIPKVGVVETINPSVGEAGIRIQESIDRLCEKTPDPKTGFRGAILLKKGFYRVDNPIEISCSGIVLRGEGQNPEGTILLANANVKEGLIDQPDGTSKDFSLINVSTKDSAKPIVDRKSTTRIISDYVAVGSTVFPIENAKGFEVGQRIVVTRTPNEEWIKSIGMQDLKSLPNALNNTLNWDARSYQIHHERTIVKVTGRYITIDIPIVDAMKKDHGGGQVSKADMNQRISLIGIEDLRLVSSYKHDNDNDHAKNAISFNGVEDVWVRGVTAQHFSLSTVIFSNSSFATVEDTASLAPKSVLKGGLRYPFNINAGGVGILFQRIYSDFGRHSFVTGAKATGPHVWVDGIAKNARSDEGPHHRWSTGLLYDNLNSLKFRNSSAQVELNSTVDPLCSMGIKSGAACCPASCGSCGGNACGERPGGPNACCTGNILKAGVSCDEGKAPCKITNNKSNDNQDHVSSFAVQNRTTSGSGHGWTGAQVMFWRTVSENYTLQAAPGSMNWAVGPSAKRHEGSPFGLDWDEYRELGLIGDGIALPAKDAQPRSLYYQQLQDRKGISSVKAVTTFEQREGRITDLIERLTTRTNLRNSDPSCASGKRSGNVCCADSCGSCGGSGCGAEPGGASACCVGTIIKEAKSCLDGKAPCVLPEIRSIDAYVTVNADPLCVRGIKKGNICYSTSCKIVGGVGCGNDPAGGKSCCGGSIIQSGVSCSNSEAPCVIPEGAY